MKTTRDLYFSAWMLSVLCCCLHVSSTFAMPRDYRAPGGVALLPLPVVSVLPPKVYYNNHRVCVVPSSKGANHWVAAVGLSLWARLGTNTIVVNTTPPEAYAFTVGSRRFPSQHLTLPNNSKVTPNGIDQLRVKREAGAEAAITAYFSQQNPFHRQYRLPAKGQFSAGFGLQRYYNGIKRSPHDGLDIATTLGSPVYAPSSGVVIAVGDYFYTGKTIYIDHGQGVISMLGHLGSTQVQRGRQVHAGQIIGQVGMTGRTTGPHVHWTVFMNGTRVDPKLFI